MALILLGGVCAIAAASYAGFVWYVANVEQPDYRSIKRAGAFELRDYPPLVVAEVTRTGGRQTVVRQGFRPLAAYIFAKERPGQAIAMTAPVMQQRREAIAMTAPVAILLAAGMGAPMQIETDAELSLFLRDPATSRLVFNSKAISGSRGKPREAGAARISTRRPNSEPGDRARG